MKTSMFWVFEIRLNRAKLATILGGAIIISRTVDPGSCDSPSCSATGHCCDAWVTFCSKRWLLPHEDAEREEQVYKAAELGGVPQFVP